MTNQHSSQTFKKIVEAKYNLPVATVLKAFQNQGKQIREIAKETGFKETTVRSYARKYGCHLTNAINHPKSDQYQSDIDKLYSELRSDRLNRINVLSRLWLQKKKV